MFIREVKPENAESIDVLMKQVKTEVDFMLMEPGERKGSPEQQRKWLERVAQRVIQRYLVQNKVDSQ